MRTIKTKQRGSCQVSRICTEIDEETQAYTECLRVPTQTGEVEVRVPRSVLSSPRDFETTLVSKGAFGITDFKAEAAHLLASKSPTFVTITRRAQWYGDCFVNRFGEHGRQGEASHRFDSHAPGWCRPKQSGTPVAQLKALDRAISQSPVLMVTLACGRLGTGLGDARRRYSGLLLDCPDRGEFDGQDLGDAPRPLGLQSSRRGGPDELQHDPRCRRTIRFLFRQCGCVR